MSSKVLLHGISDFWLRFFKDSDIIDRAHEATLEAAGRAYQDMLVSLSRLSLETTPLTEAFPWINIVLYEDRILEIAGAPGAGSFFLHRLPRDVRDFDLIHNVVLSPTRVLEKSYDFEIIQNDTKRLRDLSQLNPSVPREGWYILFYKDPFNWDGQGSSVPGFAVTTSIFDSPLRLKSVQIQDWTTTGVAAGDTIRSVTKENRVYFSKVEAVYKEYLQVDDRSTLPPEGTVTCNIGTDSPNFKNKYEGLTCLSSSVANRVRVLSAWSPSAQKDYYTLYNMYGSAISSKSEPSTEEYRAFIRGVWNLYVGGPSLARIESALNVVSGLPVIRNTYETIEDISFNGAGDITITTSVSNSDVPEEYQFNSGTPLLPEVVAAARVYDSVERDGSYTIFSDLSSIEDIGSFLDVDGLEAGVTELVIGAARKTIQFVFNTHIQVELADAQEGSALAWSLENSPGVPILSGTAGFFTQNLPTSTQFESFDTLTSVFRVTDYVEDPLWWEDSVVPYSLAPGLPPHRRTVNASLLGNFLNAGGDISRVGDLGHFVGADEDGDVSAAGYQYLHYSYAPEGFYSLGAAVGDDLLITGTSPILCSIEEVGKYWIKLDIVIPAANIADPTYVDFAIQGKTGTLPLGTLSEYPGDYHQPAWLLMNRFLKWNMFAVTFDTATASFPRTQSFVLDLILQSKPAHCYPYVRSGSELRDFHEVFDDEDLGIKVILPLEEFSIGIENAVYVGARDFNDFEDATSGDSWESLGVQDGDTLHVLACDFEIEKFSVIAESSSELTGTLFLFNGSNFVVGVGTNFIDELRVGQEVVIAGETFRVLDPALGYDITHTSFYIDSNWPLPTQSGIYGTTTARYSNRARIRLLSGVPYYGHGFSYQLSRGGSVYYSSGASVGDLLGGVGAYRNAFVGGMDPLIDRHELDTTRVTTPPSSMGMPLALEELAVRKHFVNGISVTNTAYSGTIEVDSTPFYISDTPCSVRAINVA
jgi:hypothetical protein